MVIRDDESAYETEMRPSNGENYASFIGDAHQLHNASSDVVGVERSEQLAEQPFTVTGQDTSSHFRVGAVLHVDVGAYGKDAGEGQEKLDDSQSVLSSQNGAHLDHAYTHSKSTWRFYRQGKLEPATEMNKLPGRQIIWTSVSHCAQVGSLWSVRARMVSAEHSRPSAERLVVHHITDTSNEGNELGGPDMLVHKHSRANTFALYRFYGLHSGRNQVALPSSNTERGALPPSMGILLAPKSVLTRFTNTHSTRHLEDHGLLSGPSTPSSNQHAQDDRQTPSGDAAAPIASSNTPPSLPQAQTAIVSITNSPSDEPGGQSNHLDGDDCAEEHDEDQRPIRRKAHAEAFGTLDQPTLERIRHVDALEDHKSRGLDGLLQRFRGAPASRTQADGTGAVFARPPWPTLAPREPRQSMKTRLMPWREASDTASAHRRKPAAILEQVPDDAMCMLFPLWPSETDTGSEKTFFNERAPEPLLEERLYLLVYFVPGIENKEKADGRGAIKHAPRGKGQTRARASSSTVLFERFTILARIVTYDDLRGSNLRLPVHGSSVTGSLAEAQRDVPLASSSCDGLKDDHTIAICADGESGYAELLPDLLARLGWCERGVSDERWDFAETEGEGGLK
ncbi:unnamed protein product [Peniophora sp. CBMAI 1063]|nr:unnamed protein product [Peniophora sp. CBMAI 1063]